MYKEINFIHGRLNNQSFKKKKLGYEMWMCYMVYISYHAEYVLFRVNSNFRKIWWASMFWVSVSTFIPFDESKDCQYQLFQFLRAKGRICCNGFIWDSKEERCKRLYQELFSHQVV